MLIIPSWPIVAIIVLFVFKPGVLFMSAVLAFFTWPFPTRVIMPQIASLRERPFIDLARMTGQGSWSIMFREIVPNFLPFIVLGLTTSISGSIMAETGLRIIGLGPVQLVTLGQLINWTLYAGTLSQGYFAVALSPIILLVLVFVALNFVNFGLEEVYNPRLEEDHGAVGGKREANPGGEEPERLRADHRRGHGDSGQRNLSRASRGRSSASRENPDAGSRPWWRPCCG